MTKQVEFVDGFDLREEYLKLMPLIFPQDAVARKRDSWDWIYANPMSVGAAKTRMAVYRRDGEISGMIFLLAAEYVVEGTAIPGLMPMTAMVRPKDRGTGLALLKSMYKLDHGGLSISLTNSSGMVNTYARMGSLKSEPRNLRRKFFRPGSLFARLKGMPIALGRAGDILASVVAPVIALRRPRPARGEVIEKVAAFGPEFDLAWEKAKPFVRFAHTRNAAYLQWRFKEIPHRSYECFALRRNGAVVGYVSTALHEESRGLLGRVVDIFVYEGKTDPERVRDYALLIAHADAHFRRSGCVFSEIAYTCPTAIDPAARLNGYFTHKHTREVTFDVINNPPMRAIVEANISNLHYCRSDSDEDY